MLQWITPPPAVVAGCASTLIVAMLIRCRGGESPHIDGPKGRFPKILGGEVRRCAVGRTEGGKATDTGRVRPSHAARACAPSHRARGVARNFGGQPVGLQGQV